MTEKLSEIEVRVLGCLIEKQLTTPEYYPLTLNALVAACNQKTSREPVVSFIDETVEKALDRLRDKNFAYVFYGSTSRVPKYKHLVPDAFGLEPSEIAVVCILMLRGAQTLGELRDRTSRLYEFLGLGEVSETLDRLMKREEPLVARLERQPGQKEIRFVHLFSSEIPATNTINLPENDKIETDRLTKLVQEVESLRGEFIALQATFEDFKRQFE